RLLHELVKRGVIEEVVARTSVPIGPRRELGKGAAVGLVLALSLGSLLTVSRNPLTPMRLGAAPSETDLPRQYAGRAPLERIGTALQAFYLDTGSIPDDLGLLEQGAYLGASDLLDPWGRPYAYAAAPDGYTIRGRDAQGHPDPKLLIARMFSPSERMVLDGP